MHLRKSVPKQNNILLSPKLSTQAEEQKLKIMVKKTCNENLLRPEPFRTADLEHTITFCTRKYETGNVLLLLHKKKKVICNKNCRLNHNFIPSVTWYISLTVSHFSSSQPLTLSVFLYLCFPLILSSSLYSLFVSFSFSFPPVSHSFWFTSGFSITPLCSTVPF